jgi:hypothetical protein
MKPFFLFKLNAQDHRGETAGLWAAVHANPLVQGKARHGIAPFGPCGKRCPPGARGLEIAV